jgi:hypothetical protein
VVLLDRTPYKQTIAGPLKGGLFLDLFWARNPSPFAMYHIRHTMVSIAGLLKKIIAQVCCAPIMDRGHRSGRYL